jgi:uroporphyrinogen decarboxylase
VRLLKEYFKDEIYIRGNCDQSPFSLASMMRGSQNWMLDLMMAEEGRIMELLEYCTEATSQFLKLMAQTGCDMLSNGDSPAGPDMISPDMYNKYAFPYEKKIVEVSHKAKLPYTLHICGNTDLILGKMLETGLDAIELDYKTDIKKIFDIYQNKAVLIGNIDPSGVLAMGTIDKVNNKTIELLEIYKDSNRFILNAGCAIPAETPSDNLQAMIKVAREF